ncbi:hypothetical protein I602_1310 [Polaribacter dokdonensis DSW-5]|uniref:DUF4271 domain-containing protein n=2 Tax=Polaribacter TaxID=52959 RepID=A0A0N0CFD9_9FLAO|nr:hypothetical protein I602_1310 [Polaribacter dokdonensis DSW-5]SEE04012.1 protein of unknown function [Polaribacter dokdonensis DSW-5]
MLLVCIVFLKLLNAKKLNESIFALFDFSFIEDESSEPNNLFSPFQSILFLFSVSTVSLLVYYFKIYKQTETTQSFTTFFTLFLVVFCFFFLKKVLEYALTRLFLIKNQISVFVITKANYLYSVSFILYILLILYEYANVKSVYLFYFSVFLFLLRFVFFVIRNKKLIFNKLFYFILYICAFEIAPLFVLFNLMF